MNINKFLAATEAIKDGGELIISASKYYVTNVW